MKGGRPTIEAAFFGDGEPKKFISAHTADVNEACRPLVDLLLGDTALEFFIQKVDSHEDVITAIGSRCHHCEAVSAGEGVGGSLVVTPSDALGGGAVA